MGLEHYNFTINPYGPCVGNVMVNGKHITVTVTWHVNELRVSHEDPAEITNFVNYLAVICGEKLTLHRGKAHNYLDMDLDYTRGGKVRVAMSNYLISLLTGYFGGFRCPSHYTSC